MSARIQSWIVLIVVSLLAQAAWAGPSNLIIASEGVKARKRARELEATIERYNKEADDRLKSFDFDAKWKARLRSAERDRATALLLLIQQGSMLRRYASSRSATFRLVLCRSELPRAYATFAVAATSASGTRLQGYSAGIERPLRTLDDFCSGSKNASLGRVPERIDAVLAARDVEWATETEAEYALSRPVDPSKVSETRDAGERGAPSAGGTSNVIKKTTALAL